MNPFRLLQIFDWISPSVDIATEVIKQLPEKKSEKKFEQNKLPSFYETHGYRKWVWVSCSENKKSCKGQPSCSDCFKCGDHCTCVISQKELIPSNHSEPIKKFEKEEWMCVYCSTPNPRKYRKCDSCGAARPFTY